MRICEIVKKTLAIVEKTLVIVEKIFATEELADTTAEKIFRIVAGIGVITIGISKAIGDLGVTTEKVSGITEDLGVITKGISERIAEFEGITNVFIPLDQIEGTDTLPSVTGMDIRVDHTEEEAGVKLTDVKLFPV